MTNLLFYKQPLWGLFYDSQPRCEQTGALAAKPSPLPKWSSHFQGEWPHGIMHFVLGITFSLPVWLSPAVTAGWLKGETDGGRRLAWHMLRGCDDSLTRGRRDSGAQHSVCVMCWWDQGKSEVGGLTRLEIWCIKSVGAALIWSLSVILIELTTGTSSILIYNKH